MHSIARDTMVDGRYRALRRLGVGGMAEVWCAEDEVLGRRVALKLLGGRYTEDPDFHERFRREAQAAAGLTHPNIVGIFDRSEWDGTPYIAMELVDGRTLKELVIERGPLEPGVAVNLTEQILSALGYAHRRGIVHRDVKPQNVILDSEGQAKVADFGIARAGHSEMTETGAIVGTVAYLSPEQAQGQPVDRRSDLYSAGIVLYELLTGRVPFEGEAAVSVALKHVSERPVPPAQLRPGIPPALEAVVMRALEKDPARRYQSAEEFIAALEQARRAPARQIRLDPTPGEPWVEEDEPRSRWWIWLLVLLVLAALAAGAYFLLYGNRVDVPNVRGRDASEAAEILHRRGLEVSFVNRQSDDVPREEVISQDPGAGASVKEGATVVLVISGGKGTVPVPAVDGQSQADAQRALREAGFKTSVKTAFSDSVPAGDVISTSPRGGQQATKGRTITLTVSQGSEGIPVPKVVGLQREQAESELEAAGLTAEVTEQESTQPAGTVLKQDPQAGTSVDKGVAVELTVAKERLEVPDVKTNNPTEEEATAILRQAGFKVQVRTRPDPPNVGRVSDQSPAAGTRRSTGATVTIYLGSDAAATPTPTPTP
jgi:beta-lactam-binding protein with PASTA domain